MTPCVNCGTETTPELSLATKDGLRCHTCPPLIEFHPGKGKDRYYLIDGEREINGVPITSVTTILKEAGDKFGAAAWWGQATGVKGVLTLLHSDDAVKEIPPPERSDEVVSMLTKAKLTTNHVRDDAADRGTSVHAVAENWGRTGAIDLTGVAGANEGFVDAFRALVSENDLTPQAVEVLVGSRRGAYAGTFDLLAKGTVKTWDGKTLSGVGVIDYKTKTKVPKGKKREAYEQNHLQLRAYDDARVEMGAAPADFHAVVNLYPDGTYAVIEGKATTPQWQATLSFYRAFCELKESLKTRKVAA